MVPALPGRTGLGWTPGTQWQHNRPSCPGSPSGCHLVCQVTLARRGQPPIPLGNAELKHIPTPSIERKPFPERDPVFPLGHTKSVRFESPNRNQEGSSFAWGKKCKNTWLEKIYIQLDTLNNGQSINYKDVITREFLPWNADLKTPTD